MYEVAIESTAYDLIKRIIVRNAQFITTFTITDKNNLSWVWFWWVWFWVWYDMTAGRAGVHCFVFFEV